MTSLVTWPFDEVKVVFDELKATQAPSHEHRNTWRRWRTAAYNAAPYARRLVNKPVMMIVADKDDITMWDLETAVFDAIPIGGQEARRAARHQPHDPVQQPHRAGPGRPGGGLVVLRAPGGAAHRRQPHPGVLVGWSGSAIPPAGATAPGSAGHWRDRLVDSYVGRRGGGARPSAVAVVDGAVTLTYGELEGSVGAAAASLAALGVGRGEVVSWQLPNWHEAVVLHHAVLRLGAVSNPIVPIYRHREVGYILRQAGAGSSWCPGTSAASTTRR